MYQLYRHLFISKITPDKSHGWLFLIFGKQNDKPTAILTSSSSQYKIPLSPQSNLEHAFRIVEPDEFLHRKWEGINATAPFFQRRWMSSQWGANDPRGPLPGIRRSSHMLGRVGRGDYMSWPQIYVSRSGSRQIETSSNINPHLYIIHAIFTAPRWSMRRESENCRA